MKSFNKRQHNIVQRRDTIKRQDTIKRRDNMQHQQDQCNTSKLQTNTVRWRDQHLDAQADEHKREAEKHASFMQINHEALNSIAFGNFGGSFARVSRVAFLLEMKDAWES